jgi:hypothetical protein
LIIAIVTMIWLSFVFILKSQSANVTVEFLGEYEAGSMIPEPYLRYDGMGRSDNPIIFSNPETEGIIAVPKNENGRYLLMFKGVIYEFVPGNQCQIQVYRRTK